MENAIELDPYFRPLWKELHLSGLLWHRTSPEAFERIVASTKITPNTGQLARTFPQSSVSYAWHLSAVSLFDFDTGKESEILDQEWKWGTVLVPRAPASVLIGLRPDQFHSGNLLTAADIAANDSRLDALPEKIRKGRMVIPVVEALHIGPISSDGIAKLIFVARIACGGYRWKVIEANSDAVTAIRAEDAAWTEAEKQSEQDRFVRGNVTLEDMVRASILADESGK